MKLQNLCIMISKATATEFQIFPSSWKISEIAICDVYESHKDLFSSSLQFSRRINNPKMISARQYRVYIRFVARIFIIAFGNSLFQTGSNLPKLNFSTALMSQPPPNFGVSQVSPVSMSALVSAVRSPAGGQLPPVGSAPMPPLPTIPNMSSLPPMPNMPGSMPSMAGPIRRRISDKSALSLAGGKVIPSSHNLSNCCLAWQVRFEVASSILYNKGQKLTHILR